MQTILLHEILDKDDSINSMLNSEKLVIDKINSNEKLSKNEINELIRNHKWFFFNIKRYYENNFRRFQEYYIKNPKEKENALEHYKKILSVYKYLSELSN